MESIFNYKLVIPVIRGQVMGASVLRGYAKLNDLAKMSKPDIYDQKNNPTGTQRDLSPKHARDAYEYVKSHEFGFWPEVFLCARDREVMEYVPSVDHSDYGDLIINMTVATEPKRIAISRIDGNHRLHYADGTHTGFPEIDKIVSFCIAYNLSLEQEIILFRDINANQKPMNTSHLDNIEARLTPEEKLKRLEPDLFIARKLGKDVGSPLFNYVHEGGIKVIGAIIPLRTLRTGISYMFSRSNKLTALRDVDAQYIVISNYFEAFRRWEIDAWEEPNKYIVLRGAGLWAVCFIGAEVIERALSKGKYQMEDMYQILTSGRSWDWSNKGDFQGFSGRGGALKISQIVTAEFQDETGVSVKSLFNEIMKGK